MDRNEYATTDVLSARPNGVRNYMQSTAASANRGLSGRSSRLTGSRESGAFGGGSPLSPVTSEGSDRRSQPPESPYRTHSRFSRSNASFGASRDIASPRDARISRPKTAALMTSSNDRSPFAQRTPKMRQGIGMQRAWELAHVQDQDQEARTPEVNEQEDGTIDLQQAFNLAAAEANQAIPGSPSPAPRPYRSRGGSVEIPTSRFQNHNNDLGGALRDFDTKHQLGELGAEAGSLDGLFGNHRVGPTIAQTGNTLARKASDSSMGSSPERRRTSLWGPNLSKLSSGDGLDGENIIRDSPLPSVETKNIDRDHNAVIARHANPSPEKSFNWHLDDFTAGDLSFSDSPRIRPGNTNGASAEINSQESSSPERCRGNNRFKQLREIEAAAAKAHIIDFERNTKLDEIRANEMNAFSKRAVATSRLDEIRIQNSERWSQSPEQKKNSNREEPRDGETKVDKMVETTSNYDAAPEAPVSNTSTGRRNPGKEEDRRLASNGNGATARGYSKPDPTSLDDSHELLRQLARATSSTPSPPPQETTKSPQRTASYDGSSKKESSDRERNRPRPDRADRRSRNLDFKCSRGRPTVGFAALHREPSSDSLQEKRQSHPNSEMDPTDRIEAEMKLFALQDNYSEKGSVRAPSPDPSGEADHIEETPRPNRAIDPLTQPTPRVTGAYVDTPATVKVQRGISLENEGSGDKFFKVPNFLAGLRSRNSSRSVKEPSEPDIKREGSEVSDKAKSTARSASVAISSRSHSRSRSRPRPRHPIINTANPPSVKDDLRAILRQHQIDDSTVDTFDELLADQELQQLDHEELEKMVEDTVLKVEVDIDPPGLSEQERELRAYDRMTKSLKTGLQGIRSAKQGIERLEDKVAHSEHKASSSQALADLGITYSSTSPNTHLDDAAIYISLPCLYRLKPGFRLTPLGILTLILAAWYAIESAFCFYHVSPYQSTPEYPCDWSPDEPYFPYAMPFMVDEWVTGGKGRALAWRIGEEAGDLMADVSDWITGHDFTTEDEMYMDVWERKRKMRRLRKRGLVRKWKEPVKQSEKFKSWRQGWLAKQKAMDEGLEQVWSGEDESMGADENLR